MPCNKGGYTMCQVSHVVNTIVHQAQIEKIALSPMKLQKVLYFVYKQYLKTYKKALFSERFEAWVFGPVISDVYYAYKNRKDKNINEYMIDANGTLKMIDPNESPDFGKAFFNAWDRYKRFSGIELSSFTHSPNSAWTIAVSENRAFLSDIDIEAEDEYA